MYRQERDGASPELGGKLGVSLLQLEIRPHLERHNFMMADCILAGFALGLVLS